MNRSSEIGFTLIEIIVALVIGFIVIGAGFTFYNSQYQTKLDQERIASIQQNLRSAITMLSKDIRKAGYDPTDQTSAGFSVAESQSLTFSFSRDADSNGVDDDGDSLVDEGDEAGLTSEITYTVEDSDGNGINELVRKSNGQSITIADGVDGLEFRYRLKDKSLTYAPSDLDEILSVEVALLIRSTHRSKGFSNTSSYKAYSGLWGPFNDEFKRRLLKARILCRNKMRE